MGSLAMRGAPGLRLGLGLRLRYQSGQGIVSAPSLLQPRGGTGTHPLASLPRTVPGPCQPACVRRLVWQFHSAAPEEPALPAVPPRECCLAKPLFPPLPTPISHLPLSSVFFICPASFLVHFLFFISWVFFFSACNYYSGSLPQDSWRFLCHFLYHFSFRFSLWLMI